jgi:hypothetical protein
MKYDSFAPEQKFFNYVNLFWIKCLQFRWGILMALFRELTRCYVNTLLKPKIAFSRKQGCQIFLGRTHQNRKNIPNDDKLF